MQMCDPGPAGWRNSSGTALGPCQLSSKLPSGSGRGWASPHTSSLPRGPLPPSGSVRRRSICALNSTAIDQLQLQLVVELYWSTVWLLQLYTTLQRTRKTSTTLDSIVLVHPSDRILSRLSVQA